MMGHFSHLRLRFWDSNAYTEAQALQFSQLRNFYTRHLALIRGSNHPAQLAFLEEKDLYHPQCTGKEPPSSITAGHTPLKTWVTPLIYCIQGYEHARDQRWFGDGYANDPEHLFLIYLREECTTRFIHAPANQATLDSVQALHAFVVEVKNSNIFKMNSEKPDSLRVHLHNLDSYFATLEKYLKQVISLEMAREHFDTLKTSLTCTLDEALSYLFHVVADQSRENLGFSLASAVSDTVNPNLQQALQSREGALLKNLIQDSRITGALPLNKKVQANALLPRAGFKDQKEWPPLIDEAGEVNPLWLDLFKKQPELKSIFSNELNRLPLGIPAILFPEEKSSENPLHHLIRLHGMVSSLAQFQNYLQECYKLAGLGGDSLMYDRLGVGIITILDEFSSFSEAFQENLEHFHLTLDTLETQALREKKHLVWRKNYQQAKIIKKQLVSSLKTCKIKAGEIIACAKNTQANQERVQSAAQAYETLQGAPDFLNQARRQVGKAPLEVYPGLRNASCRLEPSDSEANPSEMKLAQAPLPQALLVCDINKALAVLMPNMPKEATGLYPLCNQEKKIEPSRFFRGTHRRFCYLQKSERLFEMANTLARLQHYPKEAASKEGEALIQALRVKIQTELTEIDHSLDGLYWPFHRSSQYFFNTWRDVFTQSLKALEDIERISKKPAADGGVETRIANPRASDQQAFTKEIPLHNNSLSQEEADELMRAAQKVLRSTEESKSDADKGLITAEKAEQEAKEILRESIDAETQLKKILKSFGSPSEGDNTHFPRNKSPISSEPSSDLSAKVAPH